jgi:hypothetical protein
MTVTRAPRRSLTDARWDHVVVPVNALPALSRPARQRGTTLACAQASLFPLRFRLGCGTQSATRQQLLRYVVIEAAAAASVPIALTDVGRIFSTKMPLTIPRLSRIGAAKGPHA